MHPFLKNFPSLPDERAFRETWTPFSEFLEQIGPLIVERSKWLYMSGGQPDPDSFRGFGPTSHVYDTPATNGWTVRREDNSIGSGIHFAVSPQGEKWLVVTDPTSRQAFFCREVEVKRVAAERAAVYAARAAYIKEATVNPIPLKFEGYMLHCGWIRSATETYPNSAEHKALFRVFEDSDVLDDMHVQPHAPVWWHRGMTIQEVF